MTTALEEENLISKPTIRSLPRNVWAVSLASFFIDISSEMVINLLLLITIDIDRLVHNLLPRLSATVLILITAGVE